MQFSDRRSCVPVLKREAAKTYYSPTEIAAVGIPRGTCGTTPPRRATVQVALATLLGMCLVGACTLTPQPILTAPAPPAQGVPESHEAYEHPSGGPPMELDDPYTVGNGNWEINTGVTGSHAQDVTQVASPVLDINLAFRTLS